MKVVNVPRKHINQARTMTVTELILKIEKTLLLFERQLEGLKKLMPELSPKARKKIFVSLAEISKKIKGLK